MIKDLFYFPDLTQSSIDTEISLPAEEAKHLFVRRYKVGDTIHLFNGLSKTKDIKVVGLSAKAEIISLDKNQAKAEIKTIETTQQPKIRLYIASALPKNDRIHNMLDMATQCGMTDFIPLLCQRSVTKLKNNTKSLDRLRKYFIESCKQCRRTNIPELSEQSSVYEVLADKKPRTIYLFAHEDGECPNNLISDKGITNDVDSVVVFIGPEGGFAVSELELLSEHAKKIRLSDAILRTETAAILATATLNNIIKLNS